MKLGRGRGQGPEELGQGRAGRLGRGREGPDEGREGGVERVEVGLLLGVELGRGRSRARLAPVLCVSEVGDRLLFKRVLGPRVLRRRTRRGQGARGVQEGSVAGGVQDVRGSAWARTRGGAAQPFCGVMPCYQSVLKEAYHEAAHVAVRAQRARSAHGGLGKRDHRRHPPRGRACRQRLLVCSNRPHQPSQHHTYNRLGRRESS